MQNKLAILIITSALTLGVSACTEQKSALDNPPGTYEKSVTSTDENGTEVTQKSSTKVTQDRYGKKKAVVKSKTTRDPEGLFNKTTTSQSKEVIEENN